MTAMRTAYDLREFLDMFHEESGIPCYLYRNGRMTHAAPQQDELTLPPERYRKKLFESTQRVSFCASDYGMYYMGLRIDEEEGGPDRGSETDEVPRTRILFGPVGVMPHIEMDLRMLLADYCVLLAEARRFKSFMTRIPDLSFSAFLRRILFLNYCLSGETLHVDDFLPMQAQEWSTGAIDAVINDREDQQHNNSYELEQLLCEYVREGRAEDLKSLYINDATLHAGTIAHTPLRQLKNTLIVSTTLCTRAAIEGGLDTDTAYRTSDEFIQACEASQNADYINHLMSRIPCTFAAMVEEARVPVSTNDTIWRAIRYIRQNTNQHISAADVAEYVGLSRSWFSTLFKKELGFSVSEFIIRCRLEEACGLLKYTSRSLSMISNYLCFSSQSHFQTAFKKQYGITPMQYRRTKSVKP